MKLAYHELLMPEPIKLKNIGGLRAPSVREVVKSYSKYQVYLSLLMMTPDKYFEAQGQSEQYESLPLEEKQQIQIFDLLVNDSNMLPVLKDLLTFFFDDLVQYDFDHKAFLLFDGTKGEDGNFILTGVIKSEIWLDLCDLILQMNYVSHKTEDFSKAKNKKGLKLLERMMALRKKNKPQKVEHDPNMELGNIISSVAAKSPNLNILNIWDITIYQLWDLFTRLQINTFYDIQSTSVSVWGDKEKKFDSNGWYKNISIQK